MLGKEQGMRNHKVEPAVQKLADGDSEGAARLLKRACREKGVSRGTDEALFRLALLSLKPNRETLVSRKGRQLLKRLKKEYPSSPWTAQAAQVIELIKLVDELAGQNEDLKAAKQSLAREVEELSRSIEQSKLLDVELEKAR